jgi:peptide deformylase
MSETEGRSRRVVLYGHPALRTKSRLVEKVDAGLIRFFADLKASMLSADGLGLAANQIGETLQVFAINPRHADFDVEPYCICNPRLVASEGNREAEEGCLSLPEVFDFIPRPEYVRIAGIGEEGREVQVEGRGLMARALLHEIGHLNGELFIDHLSETRRKMLASKLHELETEEAKHCA